MILNKIVSMFWKPSIEEKYFILLSFAIFLFFLFKPTENDKNVDGFFSKATSTYIYIHIQTTEKNQKNTYFFKIQIFISKIPIKNKNFMPFLNYCTINLLINFWLKFDLFLFLFLLHSQKFTPKDIIRRCHKNSHNL
jgi:hypothetical protein